MIDCVLLELEANQIQFTERQNLTFEPFMVTVTATPTRYQYYCEHFHPRETPKSTLVCYYSVNIYRSLSWFYYTNNKDEIKAITTNWVIWSSMHKVYKVSKMTCIFYNIYKKKFSLGSFNRLSDYTKYDSQSRLSVRPLRNKHLLLNGFVKSTFPYSAPATVNIPSSFVWMGNTLSPNNASAEVIVSLEQSIFLLLQ